MGRRWALQAGTLDLDRQVVERDGTQVPLTPLESSILEVLLAAKGRVTSRQDLLRQAWGQTQPTATRAVDNTVYRLRHKLERDPKHPEHLRSVRGAGYRLDLPPLDEPLIGRHAELDELTGASQRHRWVTLCGVPGVGKRTVAEAWAARHGHPQIQARDGVSLLRQLAEHLDLGLPSNLPDSGVASRIGRAWTARGSNVVVLTDLNPDSPEATTLATSWARTGPRVVATSTHALRVQAEHTLTISPLAADHARTVYERCGPRPHPDEAVRDYLELAAGLPLVLRLIAQHTHHHDATSLQSWLSDTGSDPAQVLIGEALQSLDPGPTRAVFVLSLFPGPCPLPALATGLGLSAREAHGLTEELRRRGLATDRAGIELISPARRFDVPHPKDATRLCQRVVAWVREASATSLLDRVYVVRQACAHAPQAAAPLLVQLARATLVQGPLDLSLFEQTVRLADGLDEPSVHAEALGLQSTCRLLLGDLDGAEADLQLAIDADPSAIEPLVRQGWLYAARGDLDRAIEALERARDLASTSRQAAVEAMAQLRLGAVLHRTGQTERAVSSLSEAAGLFESVGDEAQASRCRSNLALMHAEAGRRNEARRLLEALVAAEGHPGNQVALAQHHVNLAGLSLADGALDRAREHLLSARSLAGNSGDLDTAALAEVNLGVTSLLEGTPHAALSHLAAARATLQSVGAEHLLAICWCYLALARYAAGATADAEQALGQADRSRSPAPPELLALARTVVSHHTLPPPAPDASLSQSVAYQVAAACSDLRGEPPSPSPPRHPGA